MQRKPWNPHGKFENCFPIDIGYVLHKRKDSRKTHYRGGVPLANGRRNKRPTLVEHPRLTNLHRQKAVTVPGGRNKGHGSSFHQLVPSLQTAPQQPLRLVLAESSKFGLALGQVHADKPHVAAALAELRLVLVAVKGQLKAFVRQPD